MRISVNPVQFICELFKILLSLWGFWWCRFRSRFIWLISLNIWYQIFFIRFHLFSFELRCRKRILSHVQSFSLSIWLTTHRCFFFNFELLWLFCHNCVKSLNIFIWLLRIWPLTLFDRIIILCTITDCFNHYFYTILFLFLYFYRTLRSWYLLKAHRSSSTCLW